MSRTVDSGSTRAAWSAARWSPVACSADSAVGKRNSLQLSVSGSFEAARSRSSA
ncbi:MAG: hypothetical protein KHX59_05985 [Prevotella sp.]|nr:hypothetical protein [Prevotella sp.]